MAAEAEAVDDGDFDFVVAGVVRDVVEIATFAGVIQVDGAMHFAVLDAEGTDNHGESAAGAKGVAGHALGGVDGNLVSMAAQHVLDGHGFAEVAQGCTGSVGIDVVDIGGIEPGVFEGEVDGLAGAAAIGAGGGDVEGIPGGAVADEFGVDLGSTFLGVFVFFEDEHAGAFCQDEAVTVFVPGATGFLWGVVAGGEGHALDKAGETHASHGSFGTASDDHVGFIMLDSTQGAADGVGGGGAGGGDGEVLATQPEVDADLAGSGIDHQLGDNKGTDPGGALLE